MWNMRIATAAACLLVAAPATAGRTGYFEDFVGWSADGKFYVMTSAGTDGNAMPILCTSKRGATPPSWPKKVPPPGADSDDGCTERWDMMFPDDQTPSQDVVAKLVALVDKPKVAVHGPGGETVTVKRADGEIVEIDVLRKGKRIARGSIELKYADWSPPDMEQDYWRKDGGAVAIVLGYAPAKEGEQADGYGPPSFVVVLPLDGSAANAALPPSRRQQARALNVDGMKALDAKQLDKAQKQFQAATGADDTFMLAYYNLACTASLRKDRDVSIKALRVLADSKDKDAKQYLTKGLTDHDLDWIGEDPEGAKLLKRKPAKK